MRELSCRDPLAASFRDPAGQVLAVDGRILRIVRKAYGADLSDLLCARTVRLFADTDRLVSTAVVDIKEARELFKESGAEGLFEDSDIGMVVEHEKVPFPAFPYEWPPEMLYEAARLTLDLSEGLLTEGLGLKDATPYNVLYRGPEPLFIDLLSLERRDPGDPTWLPYAQFVRTFLLPLLVNKHFGLALGQLLTSRRDGIEPEEVYRLCGPLRKLTPPFLGLVGIPTWLAGRRGGEASSIYHKRGLENREKASFILSALFRHLRRSVGRLAPKARKASAWSDYMADCSYSQDQFGAKQEFVEAVMREFGPRNVLDVGCNTGHFSAIAAAGGAHVVAIDSDPSVVGDVWRRARTGGLNILPLVVDITRPSPAVGWRNRECPAFLDRARGAFDAVLMLAVIHHMLVTERIPLPEIIDLAVELTADLLVVEFVAPDDPMFRRITRGRDDLFAGLTREVFEAACSRRFRIVRGRQLHEAHRWLYLLRRKNRPADA